MSQDTGTDLQGSATFVMATPDGPVVVEFTIAVHDLAAEDPRKPGDIVVTGWPGREGFITHFDMASNALMNTL